MDRAGAARICVTEMRPQVVVDWMSPTDGAQHAHGVGSPEALAALRLVDRQIGLLQEKLAQLGLKDKTDIIVTCDHGFDYEPAADLLAPMKAAGVAGNEVVVDNEGGGSLLYVKGHDAEKIQRLAEAFQQNDKTNVIFVAARRPERGTFQCNAGATKGWLPGTFALDLAYQCLPDHGPDLIVTFHWDKRPNPFGVPGTQWVPGNAASGQAAHNGHGGLNPWAVRSTLLLSGPNSGIGPHRIPRPAIRISRRRFSRLRACGFRIRCKGAYSQRRFRRRKVVRRRPRPHAAWKFPEAIIALQSKYLRSAANGI